MSRRRTGSPTLLPLVYEEHLPRFNATVLKRLARVWGGKEASKLNKDDCIRTIVQALAKPAIVRAVVDDLSAFEKAALGLLKFHGQTAPTREFAMQLLMLGLPFDDSSASYRYGSYGGDSYAALNQLLNKGLLVLRDWEDTYGYHSGPTISEYYYRPEVFTDLRLLTLLEPVPPVPLELLPVTGVGAGRAKQPGEVVLRFIAMAEALRKIGRIDLTKKGRPTKPFLTKLTKTLGWGDLQTTDTPLPDAALFFFVLFDRAGFLRRLPDSTVGLDSSLGKTLDSPYEAQASTWARAYSGLTGWVEYLPRSLYVGDDELLRTNKFNDFRAALLMALSALPDASAWYRMADVSEAIYQRIGDRFALGYMSRIFFVANTKNPDAEAAQRKKQNEQAHTNWVKQEQAWIERALCGPLFHLGFVALAADSDGSQSMPSCFRLTELGRAVLYDRLRSGRGGQRAVRTVQQPAQDGTCWIVQPNFDVIVFLDRASPAHLSFLERIAERKPSEGMTALYHLTRETVYAGLELGIQPDSLVETLSKGCDYPLPDNIKHTLSDWAERREQLTVYRASSILEFSTEKARDAASRKKQSAGIPIGERFLLLSGASRITSMAALVSRTIDYYGLPVRCVKASEDGILRINPARADLLIRGELASWAEQAKEAENDAEDANCWRVTQASVQKAVSSGWTAEKIIDSLSGRLSNLLPPLLAVAIRAWAKPRAHLTTVVVATDLVLQIADTEVAHAIGGSTLLQPYLRSRLGPQTFIVDRKLLKEFRKKLAGLGLEIGSDLTLETFRYLTGKEQRERE